MTVTDEYAGAPQRDLVPPRPRSPGIARRTLLFILRPEFGVAIALVLFSAVFAIIAPTFLSASQWGNILVVAGLDGIPAVGVTYLMISGEFDLSVGATFALAPMIFSLLVANDHWSVALATALALAAVAAVGAVNAAITLRLRIPSFITTLGMALFLEGIELVVNGGIPIDISQTRRAQDFMAILGGALPNSQFFAPTLWFLAIGILAFWVLQFRRYGNWVFAAGGNPLAARELGVPVDRVKSANFVTCSLLAGLAGLMQLGYVQQWNPGEGNNLELTAIVIGVLGGASLFGGRGSIVGTVIASVFVASLANGLVAIGAPSEWYTSFIGVILVAAVIINVNTTSLAGRLRSGRIPSLRRS